MYSKEFVQKIIDLRRSGMPRKEIAKLVGLSGSKVKYILQHNKVYLTQEQLIKNLTLAQTPEVQERKSKAMFRIQENNPEFVKQRNLKIKEAWSKTEVLERQSIRSKKQWEDPVYQDLISNKLKEAFSTPEAKAKLSLTHKGRISPNNADHTFQEVYDIAENEVRLYVKSLSNTILDTETFDVIPPFALDVCDPINKIALEYCGLHWHSKEFKSNTYHLNKLLMCQAANYRLITIFEDEWLSRKAQVQGFIKAIFNKTDLIKKDARKLQIQIATKEEAQIFINTNHIQIYTHCPINYKLTEDNEILAIASFSKRLSSRQIEDGTWELHRYGVKIGLNVRGGLSKIIKHFKLDFNPIKLVTYSDNRWSNGNLYKKIGFSYISQSRPSYWYFKKNRGDQRYHKSLFTKDRIKEKFPEIYNPSKKESEMMLEAGYSRIYDCGKIKWELIF